MVFSAGSGIGHEGFGFSFIEHRIAIQHAAVLAREAGFVLVLPTLPSDKFYDKPLASSCPKSHPFTYAGDGIVGGYCCSVSVRPASAGCPATGVFTACPRPPCSSYANTEVAFGELYDDSNFLNEMKSLGVDVVKELPVDIVLNWIHLVLPRDDYLKHTMKKLADFKVSKFTPS
jgi:hypothetical protein